MKTQHCLWNAAKVLLRWKFRLINAYIKKKEVKQSNSISQETRKWRKTQPKVSRKKEIKSTAEIKETKEKKKEKNQLSQSYLKITKSIKLARLRKNIRLKCIKSYMNKDTLQLMPQK